MNSEAKERRRAYARLYNARPETKVRRKEWLKANAERVTTKRKAREATVAPERKVELLRRRTQTRRAADMTPEQRQAVKERQHLYYLSRKARREAAARSGSTAEQFLSEEVSNAEHGAVCAQD